MGDQNNKTYILSNVFGPGAEYVRQNTELRRLNVLGHDMGDQNNKTYIFPNVFGSRAKYVWQNTEMRCLNVLGHDMDDQNNKTYICWTYSALELNTFSRIQN